MKKLLFSLLLLISISFSTYSQCTGTSTTWGIGGVPGWSNGLPDATKPVIITDTFYLTSFHGNLTACTLQVNPSGVLFISSTGFAKFNFDIVNNGLISISTGGTLVQVDDTAVLFGSGVYAARVTTSFLTDTDRFTYFGSPSQTQDASIFNWSSQIWDFNQVTQFWNYLGDGTYTGALMPSKGYAVRTALVGARSMVFTGTFNNGIFLQPLVHNVGTHEPTVMPGDDDSTLVGNPYPSGLDLTGPTGLIASNAINSVHLWTHASLLDAGSSTGWAGDDYIVCTLGGCTNAPTGGFHNGIASTGQGFFVNAIANDVLNINNSMRTTSGNGQFRNTETNPNADKIYLSLSNDIGYNNQILINFSENGSENFDEKYDAKKPYTTNYGMIFFALMNNDDTKLAIENRTILNDEVTIPVGFLINDESITDFTLSIDNLDDLNDDLNVYVKDNLLNRTIDLRLDKYTFDTTGTGEFNDRFEIIFTRDALSVDNEVITNDNLVVFNKNENQISIKMLNGNVITNFKAFDTLGKLVIETKPNATNFVVNTNIAQGQVLFIKVTLENGQVLSNKFMKI